LQGVQFVEVQFTLSMLHTSITYTFVSLGTEA